MRIVVDSDVRAFVVAHGGTVTVETRSQRCCTGSLTTLIAQTAAPAESSRFERFEQDGVLVYYASPSALRPEELVLKLKGRRRPRLEALWDGCFHAI